MVTKQEHLFWFYSQKSIQESCYHAERNTVSIYNNVRLVLRGQTRFAPRVTKKNGKQSSLARLSFQMLHVLTYQHLGILISYMTYHKLYPFLNFRRTFKITSSVFYILKMGVREYCGLCAIFSRYVNSANATSLVQGFRNFVCVWLMASEHVEMLVSVAWPPFSGAISAPHK